MATSMFNRSKPIVAWMLIITLSACTTLNQAQLTRDSVNPEQYRIQPSLEIKDKIRVYLKTGEIIDMTYVSSDNTSIKGSLIQDPLTAQTINYQDIQRIEVEEVDGAMTTLAVIGSVLLLPIVIIGGIFGIALTIEEQN